VAAVRPTPIVALDFPAATPALEMVETLGDTCRFYKVGSELFTAEGPGVVARLREHGCEVFLDLKLHDIPNTVASAVRVISRLGASLTTVHASGGRAMLRAAADAAHTSGECRILAVTLLTSLDAASAGEAWGVEGLTVLREVLRLAAIALDEGAQGVVCSADEAKAVRALAGEDFDILVPGVRLPGDSPADQVRVATPDAVARTGADYIVLGRSVTASADPRAAMERVNKLLVNQATAST